MEFYPKNKYLLVEPVEDPKPENKTSGFILPEDYKKVENYKIVKFLRASGDSSYRDIGACLMIVSAQLVEHINIIGKSIYVVPEAAVYGVLYK